MRIASLPCRSPCSSSRNVFVALPRRNATSGSTTSPASIAFAFLAMRCVSMTRCAVVAFRRAERNEIALLADHEARVVLGLLPLRLQHAQLRAHALRCGRQADAAHGAAGFELLHDRSELVAALAQLRERRCIALRSLLRS